MKLFLTITAVLFGFSSQAQINCQENHLHTTCGIAKYRSGNESLRSDTVDVLNYSVYLDFTEATSNILKGNCQVKFEAKMDLTSISLDLLQLNVDSILFQGNSIPFSYNDTLIVANLGTTINTGAVDSLTVYYNGTPQMDPSGWGGFYMSLQYFYNLGVGFESDPHNFGRAWHPCFDNFVERATYNFQILTNNTNTAYCNGTRTNVQVAGTDSLLTTWVMNTEIPSYLASVAVSNYTHVADSYFSTSQGISIPIWLAAQQGDTTNVKNSFLNLNAALSIYENRYGPYVWERIGYVMVPFSSGAMEHATNIAYPLITANGTLAYETLMAHELSHHWWGDWVTCETAEEMWINEGMAVYSEHLFLEQVYDYATYIAAVRDNHYEVLHSAHINDGGYYALNAVPIAYTYGDHSYKKGAQVVHSLRGYLGDADFFAGLQAVQTNLGGGDASSEQFRDAMNTISGVNVDDFFNDWIFQSGFAQFDIISMNAVQNGSNYDVELIIDQKIKAAATFYNNVPMQVTFMDANWNAFSADLNLGGDFQAVTVTVPFNPVFAALNMDEKINHAVTARDLTITNIGVNIVSYSNLRLNVTSMTDSAFVRVEQHWVYADGPLPANTILSKDRYWNVSGVDLDNITGGKLKFDFNAQNTAAGNFDNSLAVNAGGQNFHEDSLVLMYRPNAESAWQVHPDYELNNVGSPLDKLCFMETNIFMPGQYCFGYKVYSVDIPEKPLSASGYSIYPNPVTKDSIFVDLTNWENKAYAIEFYNINGQFIERKGLGGGKINQIPIDYFVPGTYIVILTDGSDERYGSKRIIIQ